MTDPESTARRVANPGVLHQAPPSGGGPAIVPLVVRDLMARLELGIARYGQPLRPFNGRDNDVDLYQELLDATIYMRGRIEEGSTPPPTRALELLAEAVQAFRMDEGDRETHFDARAWCTTTTTFLEEHKVCDQMTPDAAYAFTTSLIEIAQRRVRDVEREMANLKSGLADVFERVQQWQRETFKNPTIAGAMTHMRKETVEVERAWERSAAVGTPEALAEARTEVGDLVFLAAQAAACLGMGASELAEVMAAKLDGNRARLWGEPDAQGVVEHVRVADLEGLIAHVDPAPDDAMATYAKAKESAYRAAIAKLPCSDEDKETFEKRYPFGAQDTK